MRLWPQSKVARLEEEVVEPAPASPTRTAGSSRPMGVQATHSGPKGDVGQGDGDGCLRRRVPHRRTDRAAPLKVYRKTDGERVEADTHRSWRMLHDRPNPVTTAHNSGPPSPPTFCCTATRLWRRTATRPPGRFSRCGCRTRTDHGEFNGRRKRYVDEAPCGGRTEEQMLHIMGLCWNGLTGVSPISMCRNPLGTAIARDELEGGFYKRGAKFHGVIEHPAGSAGRGSRTWRTGSRPSTAAPATCTRRRCSEEGATFKTTQMVLEDMQFVESKQMSRSDVAIIFRIPPSYLAASTGDSRRMRRWRATKSSWRRRRSCRPLTPSRRPSRRTPRSFPSPACTQSRFA